MEILTDIKQYKGWKCPIVIALGNFDGVHLGHQQLIKKAVDIAQEVKGKAVVFTFYPHSKVFFNKELQLLNSFDVKTKLFEKLGVDATLIVPFTQEIAHLSPESFVREILCHKLQGSHLVAGFNYSFGYRGQGRAQDLINIGGESNLKVTIIEPFYIKGELVSSTKIREYLKEGSIEQAVSFLGYYPIIQGQVVPGNKIGRQIGFPTANLKWDPNLLIPGTGVYAANVYLNNYKHRGVLNIGCKPTVSLDKKLLTMEVFILNFNQDIYGEILEIHFIHKLRDEKRFTGLIELKEQIMSDVKKTEKLLSI
ncbi:MAG: bifunctional riboflavin kinase/FAD synthetase [Bacillota bacterium]